MNKWLRNPMNLSIVTDFVFALSVAAATKNLCWGSAALLFGQKFFRPSDSETEAYYKTELKLSLDAVEEKIRAK